MRVYRIERERHLDDTLKGIGASMSNSFRWNSKNTRLVYTAQSYALALLEVAVHLDLSEDLPDDRYFVEIEIPESIVIGTLNIDDLPSEWDNKPPTKITQHIGDEFSLSQAAAVLKVPSCIIHKEYNYLINPLHPEARKIKIISKEKLKIDERLSNRI